MRRSRGNKFIIFPLDVLLNFIFCIPLLLERMFRKRTLSAPNNILIIELWGMGDLIMMSPVLKSLRDSFPMARIGLLSKPIAKELFSYTPSIDEFITFDFPWTRFRGKYRFWNWDWKGIMNVIRRLRRENFDLVLDARGDLRNNILSFLIGGKKRVGYDTIGGGFFLTDVVGPSNISEHRIAAWNGLLAKIGVVCNNPKPQIQITAQEKEYAQNFLREHNIDKEDLLIGVHPGARIETRRWPLDRFAKCIDYAVKKYNAKVIVFIEPQGYGKDIPASVACIKVKASLRQIAAIIERLDLLICNDGGVMHLANAVGAPVLAIFGPTDHLRFGPCGEDDHIVIENGVSCRPCFDYCKYEKPLCLERIEVKAVCDTLDNMMSERKKRYVATIQ